MASVQILDDYMTLAELAEQFDRSEDTLRRWLREGRGPVPTTVMGRRLFAISDVTAWLKAQRREPPRRNGRAR